MTELILLTIDSLRRDHFSQDYFSKCWDTFETEFAHFDSALSNGTATPLSFPSIHTGHPPEGNGELIQDKKTIAEMYNGSTWALSNNPHLRPERDYDRGFDFFCYDIENISDDINVLNKVISVVREISHKSAKLQKIYHVLTSNFYQFKEELTGLDLSPRPNLAEHVLKKLKSAMSGEKGFFWAHFQDPHRPFKPQKVLDKEITVEYTNREIKEMNDRFLEGKLENSELQFLKSMYGEIIGYLDRQLSDFFNYLKNNNRWEKNMVVIMSDHGEAFGEEGIYSHDWSADPIDSLIKVPLLIKYPNSENAGQRYDHLVQNADLIATIANEFNWDIESPPYTQPFTDPESRIVVSKSNSAVRVTTERGQAIRRRNGPIEKKGNVKEKPMDVLDEASFPKVRNLSGEYPGVSDKEEARMKQRLRELGYLSD